MNITTLMFVTIYTFIFLCSQTFPASPVSFRSLCHAQGSHQILRTSLSSSLSVRRSNVLLYWNWNNGKTSKTTLMMHSMPLFNARFNFYVIFNENDDNNDNIFDYGNHRTINSNSSYANTSINITKNRTRTEIFRMPTWWWWRVTLMHIWLHFSTRFTTSYLEILSAWTTLILHYIISSTTPINLTINTLTATIINHTVFYLHSHILLLRHLLNNSCKRSYYALQPDFKHI